MTKKKQAGKAKPAKAKVKSPAKKKPAATPAKRPATGIGSAGPPGSATGTAATDSIRRTIRQFKEDVRQEFAGVAADIRILREVMERHGLKVMPSDVDTVIGAQDVPPEAVDEQIDNDEARALGADVGDGVV